MLGGLMTLSMMDQSWSWLAGHILCWLVVSLRAHAYVKSEGFGANPAVTGMVTFLVNGASLLFIVAFSIAPVRSPSFVVEFR